jgi:tetratricopeptide (TPR) repeat protein
MKTTFTRVLAALATAALLATPAALAGERYLDFIHGMQEKENGELGDVAVDYLKLLKAQPTLPAELAEVWDLEMSKSLQAASHHPYDEKQREQLTEEAHKYLEKFVKEKPNHPEAVTALVSSGQFMIDKALLQMRLGRGVSDAGQRETYMSAARAALTAARPKFLEATPKLKERYLAVPAALPVQRRLLNKAEKAAAAARAQAKDKAGENWFNSWFQTTLLDYYLAQTYDPADKKAQVLLKNALKQAAKGFNDIYQLQRFTVIGLYAHMWEGKCAEEMGDAQTAEDIYEEVLANVPEPKPNEPPQPATGLEPLFTQVEYFRVLILANRSTQDFINEAEPWLKLYAKLPLYRLTDGYQGVTLELAKTYLAVAEKRKELAERLRSEAIKLLRDMAPVFSQHQAEAVQLLHKLRNVVVVASEAGTFDEAVIIANTAAAEGQWAEAAKGYQRALDLSGSVKDAKRVEDVRSRLADARVWLLRVRLAEGKCDEVLAEAGKLVKEYQEVPAGRMASVVAVQAALEIYRKAVLAGSQQDRDAAMERLQRVANYTIATWPNKPEADDARMALGQAALVLGKPDEALQVFQKVNPNSERYSLALFFSAQTYWRRYLAASKQGSADKAQVAADRAHAGELLKTSLEIQRRAHDPRKPLPSQLVDAQLLATDMALEANHAQEAVKLVGPLVETLRQSSPDVTDPTTRRIFIDAVRAYMSVGDLTKASSVGALLMEIGPDNLVVNSVLVEFARLVNEERKKAEVAASQPQAAEAKAAAEAKRKAIRETLADLVKKLAQRKQLSPLGSVYLADTCFTLGLTAEARALYEGFLERLDKELEFKRTAPKAAETRVRAQLIDLLSKAGTFDKAKEQADELVKLNPRALEPRMLQARILQSWAAKEPAKYAEAVKCWAVLHNVLQSLPKKTPEFYEATYSTAFCLVQNAGKDKEKLKDAEHLLKSSLVLSPTLDGPERVAMFNALLKDVAAKLGRK